MLDEDLEGRALDLDRPAAVEAGRLASERERIGHRGDVGDLQIAGIARARRGTVATRNVRDFDGACPVVDPWRA